MNSTHGDLKFYLDNNWVDCYPLCCLALVSVAKLKPVSLCNLCIYSHKLSKIFPYSSFYLSMPRVVMMPWFMFVPLQMLLLSLMHTLENIPHLVSTSLTSTAMEVSLDWLTAHTPPQPHVVHHMLLEFAAKENLLQVSNCNTVVILSVSYVILSACFLLSYKVKSMECYVM